MARCRSAAVSAFMISCLSPPSWVALQMGTLLHFWCLAVTVTWRRVLLENSAHSDPALLRLLQASHGIKGPLPPVKFLLQARTAWHLSTGHQNVPTSCSIT